MLPALVSHPSKTIPIPRIVDGPADHNRGTDNDRGRDYISRSNIGVAWLIAKSGRADLDLDADGYLGLAFLGTGQEEPRKTEQCDGKITTHDFASKCLGLKFRFPIRRRLDD
jgi:hypothetical protein